MKYICNTLPNNTILDWPKLKEFADDKINMSHTFKFVLERVESLVGKKNLLVTSISSFSHIVFKGFVYMVIKGRDCVVKSQVKPG